MVDDFTKSDSLGRGNWLHTTSPRSNFSDKYHCRKRFRLYQNKKEPSHRGPNSLEESNLVFIHSREPRLGLWHAKAKKTLFGGIRFLQKNLDRIHSGEPWLGLHFTKTKENPLLGLKLLQQRLACCSYY